MCRGGKEERKINLPSQSSQEAQTPDVPERAEDILETTFSDYKWKDSGYIKYLGENDLKLKFSYYS